MVRSSPNPSKRLHRIALLSLTLGQLVISAQNSSSEKARPPNERQQIAALKEARRLSLKAERYDREGKSEKAERTAERALALEEQVRGAWHIEVANRLDQVADLYTAH